MLHEDCKYDRYLRDNRNQRPTILKEVEGDYDTYMNITLASIYLRFGQFRMNVEI